MDLSSHMWYWNQDAIHSCLMAPWSETLKLRQSAQRKMREDEGRLIGQAPPGISLTPSTVRWTLSEFPRKVWVKAPCHWLSWFCSFLNWRELFLTDQSEGRTSSGSDSWLDTSRTNLTHLFSKLRAPRCVGAVYIVSLRTLSFSQYLRNSPCGMGSWGEFGHLIPYRVFVLLGFIHFQPHGISDYMTAYISLKVYIMSKVIKL